MHETKNKWSLFDYEGACQNSNGEIVYAQQHIIGEFICNKVDKYTGYGKSCEALFYNVKKDVLKEMCLNHEELLKYGYGKDYEKDTNEVIERFGRDYGLFLKPIYGWHISDLKIYDKPKELSEFRKSGFMTEEEWLFNLYPNTHCHYDAWAKKFEITRPPQSWMYVEEVRK